EARIRVGNSQAWGQGRAPGFAHENRDQGAVPRPRTQARPRGPGRCYPSRRMRWSPDRRRRPSLALLLALAAAAPARAQPRDPELTWRTIDPPHFTIHYHVPLGVLARRVAVVAERAHQTLADVMGYTAQR